MKELQLLPEDWKGEIDYSEARFTIVGGNIVFSSDNSFDSYCGWGGLSFYKIEDSKIVELTPEPRPADSIKLSECKMHNIVLCIDMHGIDARIVKAGDGLGWEVRRISNGGFIARHVELLHLVKEMDLTNIKVYDMSQ